MVDGKLTLNRVIKGTVSGSKGNKIAVEVKRKRIIGQSAPSMDLSKNNDLDNDKVSAIKEILDNAKRTQEQQKLDSDIVHQANRMRDDMIKHRNEEKEQTFNSAVENKKLVNSDSTDKDKKDWKNSTSNTSADFNKHKKTGEEDSVRIKKSVKGEKTERHRLTLSKIIVEEDDDYAEGEDIATPASTYKRFSYFKKRKVEKNPDNVPTQKIIHEVVLHSTITVKDLSEKMAEKSSTVIKELMKLGIMATINQVIDADTAEIVIGELGHIVKRVDENDIENSIKTLDIEGDEIFSRPPIITVMGHVDHGKTSLLDAIRKSDVAGRESGGITQHIGAYQITNADGKMITFIDTPGHEAFSSMRARGAMATDIVVLVVAANDSIMPQTIESISHTKVAKVPMIVAINKIDLPEANVNRVKTDLLKHEVVIEELGGDVLCVEVSAKNSLNIDKLQEAILLQSELLNLNVGKNRPAEGIVIEAKMENGLGIIATVLIKKGTLKKGDVFVSGETYGRVREMFDDKGNTVECALPSMPVAILGFSEMPVAGDEFIVTDSEMRAKEFALYQKNKAKEKEMLMRSKMSLQNLFKNNDTSKVTLSIILKTDVVGSGEAIIGILEKLNNDKVNVKIIHSSVGGVNESDINLARSTLSMIVAFNVRASGSAKDLAKTYGIDIRYYSIVYNILDDVKSILEGKLEPIVSEKFIGYADVIQIFKIGKSLTVAGCRVSDGIVKRNHKCRILRNDVVIFEGDLHQLKHEKDDLKEASKGTECGISFDGYNALLVGDKIECFEVVKTAAKL